MASADSFDFDCDCGVHSVLSLSLTSHTCPNCKSVYDFEFADEPATAASGAGPGGVAAGSARVGLDEPMPVPGSQVLRAPSVRRTLR